MKWGALRTGDRVEIIIDDAADPELRGARRTGVVELSGTDLRRRFDDSTPGAHDSRTAVIRIDESLPARPRSTERLRVGPRHRWSLLD